MKISAERENSDRTQLAASSVSMCLCHLVVSTYIILNGFTAFSISCLMGILLGTQAYWGGGGCIYTHTTVYIYCYFKDDNRSVKAGFISSFA